MFANKGEVEVIPYGIGLRRVRELHNGRASQPDVNEVRQYFNYIDDLRSEMPVEEFAAKWHEYMDVSPDQNLTWTAIAKTLGIARSTAQAYARG